LTTHAPWRGFAQHATRTAPTASWSAFAPLTVGVSELPVRIETTPRVKHGPGWIASSKLLVTVSKAPGLRSGRERFELRQSCDLSPRVPVAQFSIQSVTDGRRAAWDVFPVDADRGRAAWDVFPCDADRGRAAWDVFPVDADRGRAAWDVFPVDADRGRAAWDVFPCDADGRRAAWDVSPVDADRRRAPWDLRPCDAARRHRRTDRRPTPRDVGPRHTSACPSRVRCVPLDRPSASRYPRRSFGDGRTGKVCGLHPQGLDFACCFVPVPCLG